MQFELIALETPAGNHPSALYTAVANNMRFCSPSKAIVRYDISLDAPYLRAQIEEISVTLRKDRCLTILESLLSQTKQRLDGSANAWDGTINLITGYAKSEEPYIELSDVRMLCDHLELNVDDIQLNKTLDIDSLSPNSLYVFVDSCVGYDEASKPNWVGKLQVVGGPEGVVLSEGGCVLLGTSASKTSCQTKAYQGGLGELLKELHAEISEPYISTCLLSEQWQREWLNASRALYQEYDALIELNNTANTIGYIGAGHNAMGLAVASSYLHNPLNRHIDRVWLITEQEKPQLISVTRSVL
ncbi:hypothetical protein [Pseudoalteromonas sp. M8]|uniref:hypothetical protein n=1 Tax=Pseudoalteromonas sp. M8 TaxID=2692624 RepID=UPI001BA47170|nr:hypothetical protein [Pseudoalteromonas sp. M8]QUI70984.1 hypothetical protein GSF13_15045 [Pseudoalteromonas sp. M8]